MINLSLRNTNFSHTSVPRVCLPTIVVDRVMLTHTLSCSRSSDSTWSAIFGLGIAES
jgi:hypothetical protein